MFLMVVLRFSVTRCAFHLQILDDLHKSPSLNGFPLLSLTSTAPSFVVAATGGASP